MKVNGRTANGGGASRGFDMVGEIVSVGEKVGDQHALTIKMYNGNKLKGQNVLVTLDPEVAGASSDANKIIATGMKASGGTKYGVGGIIHFQGAQMVSEQGEAPVAMARWSYMAGHSDTVSYAEDKALFVMPGYQGAQDHTLVDTAAAKVLSASDDDIQKEAFTILDENKDFSRLLLTYLDDEKDLNVGVISVMKREVDGDDVTFVRRSDSEIEALIADRVSGLAGVNQVVLLPGNRANMSKQAKQIERNGKTEKIEYALGLSHKGVLLENKIFTGDDGNKGTVVDRVNRPAARLTGVENKYIKDLSSEKRFNYILTQIGGGQPAVSQAAEVTDEPAPESQEPVDESNPFGDLPDNELTPG